MGGQKFCKRYRCNSPAARESVVGGQIFHDQHRVVAATLCRSVSRGGVSSTALVIGPALATSAGPP